MVISKRTVKRKPRRRQPVQERSRASRTAILRASAQLLARGGYAAFTTNHAAARAGVSIGTLYEYFRNKDALIDALLDEHLDDAEAALGNAAAALPADAATLPLRLLVRTMVDGMVALHRADPALHRVLAAEGIRRPRIVARVQRLEGSLITLLAGVLQHRPELPITDPLLAAKICVHTVDALTHRWIVDDSSPHAGAEQLASELTTLLLRYLTGRRAAPRR